MGTMALLQATERLKAAESRLADLEREKNNLTDRLAWLNQQIALAQSRITTATGEAKTAASTVGEGVA